MYYLQYITYKLFLCTEMFGSWYTPHSDVLSAVHYIQIILMYRNVWVLIYPTQLCTLCSTVHANYSHVKECLGPDIPYTVMYSLQYSTCKLFLCTGMFGSWYTLHSDVLSALQYMKTILIYRNVWVLLYPTQLCTHCSTVHANFSYVQECLGPDIPYTVMYSLPYSTRITELESNQRLHKQVNTKKNFINWKEV